MKYKIYYHYNYGSVQSGDGIFEFEGFLPKDLKKVKKLIISLYSPDPYYPSIRVYYWESLSAKKRKSTSHKIKNIFKNWPVCPGPEHMPEGYYTRYIRDYYGMLKLCGKPPITSSFEDFRKNEWPIIEDQIVKENKKKLRGT